jgi:hypothetical protein
MSTFKYARRSAISSSVRICRTRTCLNAERKPWNQSYSGKALVSPRLETRNLLRSVSNLFSSLDKRVFGASDLWKGRINAAVDRLNSSRPPRIAGEQLYKRSFQTLLDTLHALTVWGPNLHNARNVVTTLLDDPLSSDDGQRKLWLARHEGVRDGNLWIQ